MVLSPSCDTSPNIGEVSHEGEIDALHYRNRASGDDGDEPGRRDALVVMTLTMYRLVLASVKTPDHNDPAFGPVAGHRWH